MRRRRGGCLSVIFFIIVLIICVCIVYKMIDASSGGRGSEIIDTIVTRISMTKKEKEMLKEIEEEKRKENGFGTVFENLPDANCIRVQLTEEKMRELIQSKLDEIFPMELTDLTLDENGVMSFKAVMNRDDFLDFAEKNDGLLEGIQVLLLKLAPQNLNAGFRFAMTYNASSGKLNIDPEKLTIHNITIPVSMIPQALTDKMNVAVDEYAAPYGYKLRSIAFYDGYMDIFIEET